MSEIISKRVTQLRSFSRKKIRRKLYFIFLALALSYKMFSLFPSNFQIPRTAQQLLPKYREATRLGKVEGCKNGFEG